MERRYKIAMAAASTLGFLSLLPICLMFLKATRYGPLLDNLDVLTEHGAPLTWAAGIVGLAVSVTLATLVTLNRQPIIASESVPASNQRTSMYRVGFWTLALICVLLITFSRFMLTHRPTQTQNVVTEAKPKLEHGSTTVQPSESQLEAVEGKLGFAGMGNGDFGGMIFNSSTTAISGDVIFHVIVRDKKGKALTNRRIRQSVKWDPQHASPVLIETGWQFDAANEFVDWHIEPVTHTRVYRSKGAEVLKVWDYYEYEFHIDGKTLPVSFLRGKPRGWASTAAYDKAVRAIRATRWLLLDSVVVDRPEAEAINGAELAKIMDTGHP